MDEVWRGNFCAPEARSMLKAENGSTWNLSNRTPRTGSLRGVLLLPGGAAFGEPARLE
jgi:hypothetical protein